MKHKKVTAWLLISSLTIMTVLTGCSGKKQSEGNATPSDTVSSQPIEINYWTGNAELVPWMEKMADDYKKVRPNVTVKISSFPLRDFEKKLTTAIPSKSAADIVTVNPSLALRYIESGFIQKAPDALANFVRSGIYPDVAVKYAEHDGAVYGIPHTSALISLYYNKTMLAEAGLSGPPTTMDQIIDYARKLTKYDEAGNVKRSGLSLRLSGGGGGVAEKFWIVLLQYGGGILKEVSPGKFKDNYNNEAGLKTLQMYVDMLHQYKTDDPTIKHDVEAFQSEQTAMFMREAYVIADTAKKAPNLDYGVVRMPLANFIVVKDFYVTNSAEGDKAAAAWDFIRFMMEPDNHKQQVEMTGTLPVRTDLQMDDLFARIPQFKDFFTNYEVLEAFANIPEFDEILTKFAERLVNKGFTDPSFADNPDKMKAFLADAAKETNDILRRAGRFAE